MPTDTGLDEIALENLQASKTRLRGDANVVLVPIEADDELPTRDEVEAEIMVANMVVHRDLRRLVPELSPLQVINISDALIARGWLRVRS